MSVFSDWIISVGSYGVVPIVSCLAGMKSVRYGCAFSIGLVSTAFLIRRYIKVRKLFQPLDTSQPRYVLESIGASHYVEKVRFCMDYLGISYTEDVNAGVLKLLLDGRTVPRLTMKSAGSQDTTVCGSSDILRFLYGQYAHLNEAEFLKPTPELRAMEARIDNEFFVDVRRIVYSTVLPYPSLALELWGVHDARIPSWQKVLLRLFQPVVIRFMKYAMTDGKGRIERAKSRAEGFLSEIEEYIKAFEFQHHKLEPIQSIVPSSNNQLTYVDISFIVGCALWIVPGDYGGPNLDKKLYAFNKIQQLPQYRNLVSDWTAKFPRVLQFVTTNYSRHRTPRSKL